MSDYYHGNNNPSGFINPNLQPPNFYQPGIPAHQEDDKPVATDPWKDEEQPFQLPPDLPENFPQPPYPQNPDPFRGMSEFEAKLTIQNLNTTCMILHLELARYQDLLEEEQLRSAIFTDAYTGLLKVVGAIGGYVPDNYKLDIMGMVNDINESVHFGLKRSRKQ